MSTSVSSITRPSYLHSHSNSKGISSMTTTSTTHPLLATYTEGQILFIKWMQANRTLFVVFNECTIERANIVDVLKTSGSVYVAVPAWIAVTPSRKAHRGAYFIPEINCDVYKLVLNTNTRGRKAGSPNVKGRTPIVVAPPLTPVI